MKIKSLKLKNFHRFTDFEIEYDHKVTKLVGVNGSGKTTVGLTAIWACFNGISEKNSKGQLLGERFRFIGSDGKSADIELTLIDTEKDVEIKVTNHITKSSNQIRFDAPDGYNVDSDWLNNLLSVSLMSAKNFTMLNGRDQAYLLGINTDKFDDAIQEVKSEYTLLNRDLKNLGDVEEAEPIEVVSVKELVDEKNRRIEKNEDLANETQWAAYYENEIERCKHVINEHQEEIQKLFQSIKNNQAQLKEREDKINTRYIIETASIEQKIIDSEKNNRKAYLYASYKEWLSKVNKSSFKITSNREHLKKKEKERLDYIKSFDFGIGGVSVDDKGSLLLDNRPIKAPYFSKGELELIVAKLHSFKNPAFKVRFLDDFELLDEDNQKLIVDSLLDQGFQLITAEVGKTKKSDNSILLRQCEVIDE